MSRTTILIDSTAHIPDAMKAQYNIRVIPQTLIWGSDVLQDEIDIQADAFYRRLETATALPTTSQASPAAFLKIYREELEKGNQVLAIVVSSRLSGTYQSAVQARDMIPGEPVEVVDSYTTSLALGFAAAAAARAAGNGSNLAALREYAEQMCKNTGILFMVDTLKYLHMGGRIGGGARFLGTALNLKPILELRDGKIEAAERVRTKSKAIARLIELTEEKIAGRTPLRLAVLHANAEADARAVLEEATRRFSPVETILGEVSPVVGTHAGPGTVGIAYMVGE